MSTRDTSLDPKILQSAKKEFLAKGFLDTSLTKICEDAGVTTGAIYRRYNGKEGLFIEVVKPGIAIFNNLTKEGLEINKKRAAENKLHKNWMESLVKINYWIEKLYAEAETVKILLSKSDGTIYSNFMHDFIEENFNLSYTFMKDLESKRMCKLDLSYEEYHILLTSFWTAIFEMIIHDFTLDEALNFAPKINKFFAWNQLIEF